MSLFIFFYICRLFRTKQSTKDLREFLSLENAYLAFRMKIRAFTLPCYTRSHTSAVLLFLCSFQNQRAHSQWKICIGGCFIVRGRASLTDLHNSGRYGVVRIARMQIPIVTEIYAASGCESRIASETRANRTAILLSTWRSGYNEIWKQSRENWILNLELSIF